MPLILNGDGAIAGLTAGGLPDASITQADLAANIAGNGPACSVSLGTNQSLTNNTWTKLSLNTELFDTNNNFDTTTNRFLPTVAGYYQISAQFDISMPSITGTAAISLYKNGSSIAQVYQTIAGVGNNYQPTVNKLVYMNGTTDYLEVFGFQNAGSTRNVSSGDSATYFTAALLRTA